MRKQKKTSTYVVVDEEGITEGKPKKRGLQCVMGKIIYFKNYEHVKTGHYVRRKLCRISQLRTVRR